MVCRENTRKLHETIHQCSGRKSLQLCSVEGFFVRLCSWGFFSFICAVLLNLKVCDLFSFSGTLNGKQHFSTVEKDTFTFGCFTLFKIYIYLLWLKIFIKICCCFVVLFNFFCGFDLLIYPLDMSNHALWLVPLLLG